MKKEKTKISQIKNFLKNLINQVREHPIKVLSFLAVYSALSWIWGFEAAVFLGIFYLFLIFRWEPRIFIAFGLLFLLACPFYLIFQKQYYAEESAIYAYYSLALGVILQLAEYVRKPKNR